MRDITPLFLGILGTFAFSWAGLTMIPNAQIGNLEPQTDEEGADPYPAPKSGLAERGRQVYVANGCVYCHSQQVRPDYAASDLERNWGQRRSAPRDYIFERPALLGKMRMGPDLANVGRRAPADDETAPPPGATGSTTGAQPPAAPPPAPAPATSAPATAGPAAGAPPAQPAAPAPAAAAAAPGAPPAAANASVQTPGAASAQPPTQPGAPATLPPGPGGAPSPAAATAAQTAVAPAGPAVTAVSGGGQNEPLQYSAAWHHRHLYDPRSINFDSTMPAFRFLYEKRRVTGQRSAEALVLSGPGAPSNDWEIVPTPDATALVAYLMSLDQTHELKEVKATNVVTPPAPGKAVK